jgi:hypothetical protein
MAVAEPAVCRSTFDVRTDIVAELAARRYVVLQPFSPDDTEQVRERARRATELLRDRRGVIAHIGIREAGPVGEISPTC